MRETILMSGIMAPLQQFKEWVTELTEKIPQPDPAVVVPYVNSLGIKIEALILLLQITAIAAAAMGLIVLVHTIHLRNSLPVRKAKQFIEKRKRPIPAKPEPIITILQLPEYEQPEVEVKKPLIDFTLTAEAQQLLNKITVEVNVEDGWNVAPSRTPAA